MIKIREKDPNYVLKEIIEEKLEKVIGKGIREQMEEANVLHYDQFSLKELEKAMVGIKQIPLIDQIERMKNIYDPYKDAKIIYK